jgi:putative transposase
VVATNEIKQSFNILEPYQVWVTDITYIREYEGWLYLAVIIDLYSLRVLGWSMQSHMQIDLVLIARLMAVLRRKPIFTVIIHSDQERRFTSLECKSSLKKHNLAGSMSHRGICYDNTAAESLFTY